ncbi:MAG TPA: DUF2127 domain-containing protein, partial [Candidatus Eisenbacteria bacterium]|nr:DUF2127 domain-containing protein [Candidatus Eisenbacteria bacterium]
LALIGGFKLVKGLALLAVAVGAHHLLHKDIADFVATGIAQLHLDPDNRYIGKAMAKVLSLDERRLRAIGAGSLVYAALLLTEGIGLLLRRRWAEYFTVIVTGSFIPLEIYELARRLTWGRLVLLGVNVAVVWYLIGVLRRPDPKGRVRS